MNLPGAPDTYDARNEQATRRELLSADKDNYKKGQDVKLQRGERLVLMSPNGTLYALSVDNAGVLSTVAYP